jgi:hypothetical protein
MRIQVTSKEVEVRGRQISSRLTNVQTDRQTAVGVEIEIQSESGKDCVDD